MGRKSDIGFWAFAITLALLIAVIITPFCVHAKEKRTFDPVKIEAEIYLVVLFVLKETNQWHKREEISRWDVQIHNDWIVQPVGSYPNVGVRFYDGYTDIRNKVIHVFHYQDCLAASSLVHELMHALGYIHGPSGKWPEVERLEKRAVKEICPDGYKVLNPPKITKEEIQRVTKELHGIDESI